MRTLLRTSVAVGGLAVLALLAGNGTARADTEDLMVVKVPFSFVAEGRTLPAGRYVIERENPGSSVLFLKGEGGLRVARFVPTIPASGFDPNGNQPALTFSREGNQYHLSVVWETRTKGEKLVR